MKKPRMSSEDVRRAIELLIATRSIRRAYKACMRSPLLARRLLDDANLRLVDLSYDMLAGKHIAAKQREMLKNGVNVENL